MSATSLGGRIPRLAIAALLAVLLVMSCSIARPFQTGGAATLAEPARLPNVEEGIATFYARFFDGRLTASGTPFDNEALLAAHPSLPFGTLVRVTNLENDRSVAVRIVDRGPAAGPRESGVIIDLSRAAADALDFIRAGRARVRLAILDPNAPPAAE